ncbi:siroheme uroporphyrinogen methyltransferase 1 [Iris pallida]|uniref:uroporphyrinogen-III C-methyltransferase n=1 Tax=Iris pallida TaxID=29817 RepID=A0AAX6HGZ7_IRIPA|nr:siroheme uroporphyrinogen methyltransferase 1 [Iris pallida]
MHTSTSSSSSSYYYHHHTITSISSRRNLHFPSSPSLFRRTITLSSSSSSSSSSSPFTEFNSKERRERDSWLYDDANNDISLRLPDLKNLLRLLQLKKSGGSHSRPGRVSLVGTGPGDPDLLTVKAAKAVAGADLVLYDRLVSHEVLSLARDDARLLYVGKTAGYHSRTQDEIHRLLLAFAEAGANVVRLKGGDPLVFGRGGEEMDFLRQQGIEIKVIPGITSASGIAAELGIPLTHRGVANSVRFLTGHSRNGGTDPLYVSEHAADPDSTLVIYMGLSTLPALAQKLMNHGLPSGTPAVAVERGTTPQQRTVFSEIKDLVNEVKLADLVSPTLIIIGKVVALSPLWPQSFERTSMQSETCSFANK